MNIEKKYLYHIYNQGNNRKKIFFKEKNYSYFLQKVKTHIKPYADIIAYCLMPNHFHFMLLVNEVEISRGAMTSSRASTGSENAKDWKYSSAKDYANIQSQELINKEVASKYIKWE